MYLLKKNVILLIKWWQECVLSNSFVMQLLASPFFFFSKIQSCSEKERKMNFLLNLLIVKRFKDVLIPFVNCLPVFTLLSD